MLPEIDWKKVADALWSQGDDAMTHAEALRKVMPEISTSGNGVAAERAKTIERHRINANFCFAMATALDAGLGISRARLK